MFRLVSGSFFSLGKYLLITSPPYVVSGLLVFVHILLFAGVFTAVKGQVETDWP